MAQESPHISVLLDEVVRSISPLQARHVVDGTFGAGGYSRAFLQAGARVTGIDRDPNVLPFAQTLSDDYGDAFKFVQGRFADLEQLATENDFAPADAIVLDIGVSSMQLDEGERGFSFMRDGPLDMRMEQHGESAADLVNERDEREISDILFELGEERRARHIAHAIVERRADKPFQTTTELAELIAEKLGRKPGGSHPATKSFQALRIAVNAEYGQLVRGLFAAEEILTEGGVLAVVSFHSVEDRIVKRFFKPQEKGSRHAPMQVKDLSPWANISKPIRASRAELDQNPRARSATLRFAVRNDEPARTLSIEGLGVPGYARREFMS
ncbi:16S rRNA (cytosine(1402)-N(4))-methyltransferase RsmH [Maritalea sp.]|uniref:16S rRNA (cytosine(1402)-N(4))-methyltransferase RsmH n=1 Tax=Maritalea sp. TaxID=2003361 RepID=UPI0039E2277D